MLACEASHHINFHYSGHTCLFHATRRFPVIPYAHGAVFSNGSCCMPGPPACSSPLMT